MPRGHALGRSLDANVRRLPGPQPAVRARPAAAHLPQRRASPPPSPAAAARRARAARAHAADRADARSTATSWPRRCPTSSATLRPRRWSGGCSRAARATRCTPRSCWPPGWTAAAAAPQSLRDAFLLRIERLSTDAQTVARAIAVGRELERATGRRADRDRRRTSWPWRCARRLAEQILLTGAGRVLRFRHELLREVLYDDLLPGERSELHLALAACSRSGRRARPDDGRLERAATIAGHYAAAGDQPAALRATVRAALAAAGGACATARRPISPSARSSCGRGSPVADRPEAIDHVELLCSRPRACTESAATAARARVLLQSALRELDPDRRSAPLRLRTGASGPDAVGAEPRQPRESRPRNGHWRCCPRTSDWPERASLLAWLARTRVLRGPLARRGRRRRAGAGRRGAGRRRPRRERGAEHTGHGPDGARRARRGIARLRRAIEIARDNDDIDELGYAYANLADLLNLRGHTARGAAHVAQEGLAAIAAAGSAAPATGSR